MRNENISSFNLSLTIFSCNSLHAEMVPDRPMGSSSDSGRCPVQTIVSFVIVQQTMQTCVLPQMWEKLWCSMHVSILNCICHSYFYARLIDALVLAVAALGHLYSS
jgi:hypothetical protein